MIGPHRAWMVEQYAAGMFLVSGPRTPHAGAVILGRGDDRASLEHLLSEDPVAQTGLADYQVVEFRPSSTAPGLGPAGRA